VLNPRYLDFAHHYGFAIKPCAVRQPQQKGRVEKGVDYVKGNFLRGLDPTGFAPLNPAVRVWLDTVANVRVHGETHQTPAQRFALEKPRLRPLSPLPYEAAAIGPVRASRRFRVTVDTNRYSVPARLAGATLTLKAFANRTSWWPSMCAAMTATRIMNCPNMPPRCWPRPAMPASSNC